MHVALLSAPNLAPWKSLVVQPSVVGAGVVVAAAGYVPSAAEVIAGVGVLLMGEAALCGCQSWTAIGQ